MKTRQAFVANSSSSSFVIAYRDITKDESYEALPQWAKRTIMKFTKRITKGKQITTVEALNKYLIDQYGCDDDTIEVLLEDNSKRFNDVYKACVIYLERGYSISYVSVDYDDESGNDFFGGLPDTDDGDGIVLISEEC